MRYIYYVFCTLQLFFVTNHAYSKVSKPQILSEDSSYFVEGKTGKIDDNSPTKTSKLRLRHSNPFTVIHPYLQSIDSDTIILHEGEWKKRELKDYPKYTSEFKMKSSLFRRLMRKPVKYEAIKYQHFLEPQEAMSFEVDSALIGFMHNSHGIAATGMSAIASVFAFGSCIMGTLNIFDAVKNNGKAEDFIDKINHKIHSTQKAIKGLRRSYRNYPKEQNTSKEEHKERERLKVNIIELKQNLAFYQELKEKIQEYLKDEDKSMAINALISAGTFSEFLGFIGSDSLLGSSSLFPALAPVAQYFLAGGIIVVSATSLWEAANEAKQLAKLNTRYIPGLEEEILVIPQSIKQVFQLHEKSMQTNFRAKINHVHSKPSHLDLTEDDFTAYLKAEYIRSIKNRVHRHTVNRGQKIASRLLIGLGTAVLSTEQIAMIAGAGLIPTLGLTISGIGTGVGVGIGILGYIYYNKHIKTAPLLDVRGIHTKNIEVLRMEILSILLKLNLTPPPEDANFHEKFRYFTKLSPIDDFSGKIGDPKHVPFIGKYQGSGDFVESAIKQIERLKKKGILNRVLQPLLRKYFKSKQPHQLKEWSPYVTWNQDRKMGRIHWTPLIYSSFREGNMQTREFFSDFVNQGIEVAYLNLQEELKITIDQLTHLIRKYRASKPQKV